MGGEPKWFDVRAIADLCGTLDLGNSGILVAAITASSVQLGSFTVNNPIEEIRVCRNCAAHKGNPSMIRVVSVAGAGFVDMPTHLQRRRFGVEVFQEWEDACRAMAEAAAQ